MITTIKHYLEGLSINPLNWLYSVLGIVLVRCFLEALSSPSIQGFLSIQFSTLLHYFLFYVSFALVFMILVHKAVPSFKNASSALGVFALSALFLAPILDFLISRGKGATMAYLFDTPREMLTSLLSFFGSGMTLGIRIEALLILAVFAVFVYLAEKSILRSAVSTVALYLIIFVFLSFPSFISFFFGNVAEPVQYLSGLLGNSQTILNNLHPSFKYATSLSMFEIGFNFFISKVWFLVAAILSIVYMRMLERDKWSAMFKNSRPERVAHYMLMLVLGIVASYSVIPVWKFNGADYLTLIVLAISIYFSWMFAVCVNDIVDEDIDKVSNTDRPLVESTLDTIDMKTGAILFLVASLVGGYLSGYASLFFLVAFTALYFIYSALPTRFKLVPFFSSFIIGLCCLAVVLAGFFLTIPLKSGELVPTRLIVGVVVIFFLWSHIRDMKDIEGDSRAGVRTVPVLFGPKWGPRVVGILAGLAYLLVPLFSKFYLLTPLAVLAAFATYYYVNKKTYREKPLFFVYGGFVILSVAALIIW